MYNFDNRIYRKNDHSRKWTHKLVCDRFGVVQQDFIPLWIADMDFKSPPEVIARLRNIVDHGTFGYTYCYDEFYHAVIDFQATRHAACVRKEWITLSYGTVSTMHYLVQAFCAPGNAVIMNTPVYTPFAQAVMQHRCNVIYNSLIEHKRRYHIDFDKLEYQLKTLKPRLYLFCSPHNPSGRIWSNAEIKRVSDLCVKYGTILVVDEVHAEHVLKGKFHSALTHITDHENLIVLSSPNKAFNLGGLKTSYSIIPSLHLRNTFRKQLQRNSITSPNLMGVAALVSAYNDGLPWLDALNDYLRENEKFLYDKLSTHLPKFKMMRCDASYLAWIDISETGLNAFTLTSNLARETGVIVEDGTGYVRNGENFIRINFGTQRSLLDEALTRMINHMLTY